MKKEEFIKEVELISRVYSQCYPESGGYTTFYIPNPKLYCSDIKLRLSRYDKKTDWDAQLVICYMWETGGVSGGSCWESSNPQPYISNKKEPEWNVLDKIFEKFRPNISYLEYKKLVSSLEKKTDYTEHEYYGNKSHYDVKYIVLDELYQYFVDNKWF